MSDSILSQIRRKMTPLKAKIKGWGSLGARNKYFDFDSQFKFESPDHRLRVGEVFVYHRDLSNSGGLNFPVETVKVLYIKQEKSLSLHFHVKKTELFYMIIGSLEVTLIKDGVEESFTLKAGDSLLIEPGMVHSMKGLEVENALLEVSSLDRDDDSYRIRRGD